MFMRPTDFSPQITYNDQLLGAGWKSAARKAVSRARSNKRLTRGEARAQFFNWLQNRHPKLADKTFGYGAGTLGEDAPAAKDEPWYKSFSTALPGAVTAYTQYKMTKLNLDRAKKGLPPIDSAAYAPTVKVQAQVEPQIKNALFIGGGIIAAAAVVAALRR